MQYPISWRLKWDAGIDRAKLDTGIARHLAVAPLQTMLVQRAGVQRSYLLAPGCASCSGGQGRCVPGCYVQLMQRLARASGGPRLERINQRLRAVRIVEALWLMPTPAATPLDATLLPQYADGALVVNARPTSNGTTDARALLLCSRDLPEAILQLRERGWRVRVLPPFTLLLAERWLASTLLPLPGYLPGGRAANIFRLLEPRPHPKLLKEATR
jgi:hypothetical protein